MPFQKGHIPWHKGLHLSEEHKRKISEAQKGRPKSDRTKRRMSEAAKRRERAPMSERTKSRISIALKGNQNCLGRHLSEETKRKMADGNRGKILSPETRRKIGEAQIGNTKHLGKPHSEESKRKIGLASKGHSVSDETRRKTGRAMKQAWANGLFDDRNCPPPYVMYKGIPMRSSWEARLAQAFDDLGWAWDYEPRKFQYELADGPHTYTPDFYVSHLDCYFDPHGDWRYLPEKFDAVRYQCDIALIILDKQLLAMYENVASVNQVT